MGRHLTAARQAVRSYRHPTFVRSSPQPPTYGGFCYRLHFLRSMSSSSSAPPPPAASAQCTAVPEPVSSSLRSLLRVCVDGLCSRRLQWEELVVLVSAGRLEAMGRLDWQLSEYGESKAAMLREYHSVTDRLRDRRLAAPCRLDEDGRKRCDWTQQQSTQQVEPPPPGHPMRVELDDEGRPLRVCWWKNEYGYAIDEGIGHHLVWTDRYLSPQSRLFQRILSEHKPSDEYELLTFINPPHLRSIPDINHIHVFSRRRGVV